MAAIEQIVILHLHTSSSSSSSNGLLVAVCKENVGAGAGRRHLSIYDCASLAGCYIYELSALEPVLIVSELIGNEPITRLICSSMGAVLTVVAASATSMFKWEFAIDISVNVGGDFLGARLSLVDMLDCRASGDIKGLFLLSCNEMLDRSRRVAQLFAASNFLISLEGNSIIVRSENFKKVRQFSLPDSSHVIQEFCVVEHECLVVCRMKHNDTLYGYDIETDSIRFRFNLNSAQPSSSSSSSTSNNNSNNNASINGSPRGQPKPGVSSSEMPTLVSLLGLGRSELGSFVAVYSDGMMNFYTSARKLESTYNASTASANGYDKNSNDGENEEVYKGNSALDLTRSPKLVGSLSLPPHFDFKTAASNSSSFPIARHLSLAIDTISIGVIAVVSKVAVCLVGLAPASQPELLSVFRYEESSFLEPASIAVSISGLMMVTEGPNDGDIVGSLALVSDKSPMSIMLSCGGAVFNGKQEVGCSANLGDPNSSGHNAIKGGGGSNGDKSESLSGGSSASSRKISSLQPSASPASPATSVFSKVESNDISDAVLKGRNNDNTYDAGDDYEGEDWDDDFGGGDEEDADDSDNDNNNNDYVINDDYNNALGGGRSGKKGIDFNEDRVKHGVDIDVFRRSGSRDNGSNSNSNNAGGGVNSKGCGKNNNSSNSNNSSSCDTNSELARMENLRIHTEEMCDEDDDDSSNYCDFNIEGGGGGGDGGGGGGGEKIEERQEKAMASTTLSYFLGTSSEDQVIAGSFLRKTLEPAATPVVKQGARIVNGITNTAVTSAVSGKHKIDKVTGKVVDLPVTFHSKIKSSGYGQGPQDSFARLQLKKAQAKARAKLQAEREKEFKLNQRQQAEALSSSDIDPSADNSNSNSSNNNSSSNNNGVSNGVNRRRATGPLVGARIRNYPLTCGAMTQAQPNNTFPLPPQHGSSSSALVASQQQHSHLNPLPPIHKLCYNGDGSALAFATTDNNVSILRLPTTKYAGDALHCRGHNGAITHVAFSRDKNMVISSSKDGTARIWRNNPNPDPLVPSSAFEFQSAVIFSHVLHPPSQSLALKTGGSGGVQSSLGQSVMTKAASTQPNQKGSSKNVPFGEEIHFAKFFFMDKFAAISSKSSVFMYLYDLGNTSNDLRRLQTSPGSYKIAHRWTLSGTRLTSFNCINTVQSGLLFAATSDKKLHVLDAESGGIARSIDIVATSLTSSVYSHDRSVHSIALPSPSLHASVTTDHFNFFATAAIDNSVILWDLRQACPTHRYAGHVNRKDSCGVSISPCLKYVCVGSEDRSAHILDIRYLSDSADRLVPLARLTGHGDVVSDVGFHPLFPQLATASHDGRIRFFMDPGAQQHPNLF